MTPLAQPWPKLQADAIWPDLWQAFDFNLRHNFAALLPHLWLKSQTYLTTPLIGVPILIKYKFDAHQRQRLKAWQKRPLSPEDSPGTAGKGKHLPRVKGWLHLWLLVNPFFRLVLLNFLWHVFPLKYMGLRNRPSPLSWVSRRIYTTWNKEIACFSFSCISRWRICNNKKA